MPNYRAMKVQTRLMDERKAKSAAKYGNSNHSPGDYSDVKWMELRNRALIRDGYKCQACAGVIGLQVHHVRYIKGGKIWDSPLHDLVTLCKECHKKVHGILRKSLEAPKGRHKLDIGKRRAIKGKVR